MTTHDTPEDVWKLVPSGSAEHAAFLIGIAERAAKEAVAARNAEIAEAVRALPSDCHDWYSEGSCGGEGCSAVERDAVLAVVKGASE
jgi:hypothetical protein